MVSYSAAVLTVLIVTVAVLTVAVVAYGWFEAGWLRTRVLEVELDGFPAALDGLRIGHLSDFHLGAALSRGNGASARAVDWVAAREPDLVCVTGDLVSHPRGEPRLRALLARLDRPYVILGNHDVALTRDPFSRAAELRDLEQARLLRDDAVTLTVHGETVSVIGVDPETYRARRAQPHTLVDCDASLRLLLCHFPGVTRFLPAGSFDLILAGHLHAGQICLPWPGRRVTLAHPRARYVAGLYHADAGVMHVSPGTGTTFLPLRLFARPEVTELVLRSPKPPRRAARESTRTRGHASRLTEVEHVVISHDVLAEYAADAAREVDGVVHLVEGARRRHGVRVTEDEGTFALGVYVAVGWGTRAPDVGAAAQRRVAEYVRRTAKVKVTVDVVIAGIAPSDR